MIDQSKTTYYKLACRKHNPRSSLLGSRQDNSATDRNMPGTTVNGISPSSVSKEGKASQVAELVSQAEKVSVQRLEIRWPKR